MDFSTIEQLCLIMKSQGLSALEVEEQGTRIRLENTQPSLFHAQSAPSAATPLPLSPVAPVPEAAAPSASPATGDDYLYVTSPMVGIFVPLTKLGKPELEPGQSVEPETLVCAVEAMKMVCEIKAELTGQFVELLVQEGDQVEFGQPLMKLKKPL